METKEGRRKRRATSQGRGSAWVEPKQVLLLVAPSMLCLFPVFISTATKINLSKPQPSP
ncbi:hypothetical protein Peur_048359 [Populus x canadensis]